MVRSRVKYNCREEVGGINKGGMRGRGREGYMVRNMERDSKEREGKGGRESEREGWEQRVK